MRTELKIYNAQKNYGKMWCKDCAETLAMEEADDYGMEALEQSAINMLIWIADRHARLHPTHDTTITVYERNPQT